MPAVIFLNVINSTKILILMAENPEIPKNLRMDLNRQSLWLVYAAE